MKIRTTCIVILAAVMALTACTKEGNTVYQPDPSEPKASTAPLVTVIYGTDAVGDRSYSDLIYKGIEEAAAKHGLRTMQLSPTSYQEGLGYLQSMFQNVRSKVDTIRRLYIVEAGAILPVITDLATLILSNPEDQTVVGAAHGFSDGFQTDYYRVEYEDMYMTWEKKLKTVYLAKHAGEGYNIADSTALQVLDKCKGTIGECDHESSKYTISDCPWCHSYDKTLN